MLLLTALMVYYCFKLYKVGNPKWTKNVGIVCAILNGGYFLIWLFWTVRLLFN